MNELKNEDGKIQPSDQLRFMSHMDQLRAALKPLDEMFKAVRRVHERNEQKKQ